MKKLLTLLSIGIFPLLGFSQQTPTRQTCAVDEQVLLNERPAGVSERNALMLIRGEAELVIFNQKEKNVTTSVFPPLAKNEVYKSELRLKKESAALPVWEVKDDVFYRSTKESLNTRLLACWIICFLISFGVNSFCAMINPYKDWDYTSFKNYTRWCLGITILAGVFAYVLSLSTGTPAGPGTFYTGPFIWTAYIATILVGVIAAIIALMSYKKIRKAFWVILITLCKKKDIVVA